MTSLSFLRVALGAFHCNLAAPLANVEKHIALMQDASANKNHILVFPELSTTGATCGDLYSYDLLLAKAEEAVVAIVEESKKHPNLLVAIGAPIRVFSHVYNCAILLCGGRILQIFPKNHHQANKEYLERSFADWSTQYTERSEQMLYAGQECFFSREKISLQLNKRIFTLAVLLGEEKMPSVSAHLFLHMDSKPSISKSFLHIERTVSQRSIESNSAYIYQNASTGESSAQYVFGGEAMLAECGEILGKQKADYNRKNRLLEADIDLAYIDFCKAREKSSGRNNSGIADPVHIWKGEATKEIRRYIDPYPFIPDHYEERSILAEETLQIMAAGLARRVEQIQAKKLVIGVSGGLDSTLALLVAVRTMKLFNRPNKDILGIRMSGFGTSDETYSNAVSLMDSLNIESRDISIVPAILQHFEDIGHDPEIHDTSYENAQARERTQLLMDIANKENGLVIGTGDLSEIALGWSTYNGDQMSMYSVNSSIPKTLIRPLLQHEASLFARESKRVLADTLDKISATAVSPELLPPDKEGKIAQKTEDIIGPYVLHDFFLYHFILRGASPAQLYELAKHAFQRKDKKRKDSFSNEEIKQTERLFFRRFYTQQFKRQASPDGIIATSISLSPAGRFQIPSDLNVSDVLAELDQLDAETN